MAIHPVGKALAVVVTLVKRRQHLTNRQANKAQVNTELLVHKAIKLNNRTKATICMVLRAHSIRIHNKASRK